MNAPRGAGLNRCAERSNRECAQHVNEAEAASERARARVVYFHIPTLNKFNLVECNNLLL